MKSKNGIAVVAGIIIFALLIVAAISLQSAYMLFAASAIPILLAPFIPDIPSNQKLKPGKLTDPVRIYRTSAPAGEGFLVIDAAPGSIHWNKRRLYFPTEGIPAISLSVYAADKPGIPVLEYDLVRHPRKSGMYGINLAHLKGRITNTALTTDEVTRLVIRMEDLAQLGSIGTKPHATTVKKGLQA